MKILVTGITGQLGHDVMKVLAARGHEAIMAPSFMLSSFCSRPLRCFEIMTSVMFFVSVSWS